MPSNQGQQQISLKFKAPGNSEEINRRFKSTHPTGIYSGGILTVSDGSHVNISPLVCEIADGTHQVRVETTLTVNLSVASGTPYVILRWTYTGDTQDYMEILAVAVGSVLATDLVVGKCVFTTGSLSGFDYGGTTTLHRSVPSVHDLFLKVVPTVGTTLKALVLPGWIHGQQNAHFVPMQETSALVPPLANSKIYLVILAEDGTISIDSTGTEAVDPVEPNHNSRIVLAQIKLSAGDTTITSSKITDVRTFVTQHPPSPDGTTILEDASGQLKTRDPTYLVLQDGTTQAVAVSVWTKLTFSTQVKSSGISESLGVITITAGRLYQISFTVQMNNSLFAYYAPWGKVRLRVVSGDISWGFQDSEDNVSLQDYYFAAFGTDGFHDIRTLSGTYTILPASTTTIQLEALTKDSVVANKRSQVVGCSLSVISN